MTAITLAGESLIAQKAANNEALVIDQFVIANISALDHESAVDRNEAMPTAENIVWQGPVTQQGYVNPNQVVYSLILGTDVGDFDFNWIGLYSSSDDVLVSISYAPLQSKVRAQGSTTGNNITRNFMLGFDGAQTLTGMTVDASTWQADWTARLNDIDDRESLSNMDTFGETMFINDAYKLERNGSDFLVSAGVAYLRGVRISLESNQAFSATEEPTTIWLDMSFNGGLEGKTAEVVLFDNPSQQSDFIDSSGDPHTVVPLADVSAVGDITDLRGSKPLAGSIYEHLEVAYSNIEQAVTGMGGDSINESADQLLNILNTAFGLKTDKTTTDLMQQAIDSIMVAVASKANSNGDYASLRARATTKTDVGLSSIPNSVSSSTSLNNSSVLATSAAVYNVSRYLPHVAGLGGVGSLAFMTYATNADVPLARGTITRGATYPGSHLMYAGVMIDKFGAYEARSPAASKAFATGTWRALGHVNYYGNAAHIPTTLFVRIS